ncbi:hypothetical protein DIPPA_10256 [Diplonema papillatum]|nr:hypothetical protein DIPPA_10256 [Diplonema papillatum]
MPPGGPLEKFEGFGSRKRKAAFPDAEEAGRLLTPYALWREAKADRLDGVRALMEAGVDVNGRGAGMETPLIAACANRSHEMVELLLSAPPRGGPTSKALLRPPPCDSPYQVSKHCHRYHTELSPGPTPAPPFTHDALVADAPPGGQSPGGSCAGAPHRPLLPELFTPEPLLFGAAEGGGGPTEDRSWSDGRLAAAGGSQRVSGGELSVVDGGAAAGTADASGVSAATQCDVDARDSFGNTALGCCCANGSVRTLWHLLRLGNPTVQAGHFRTAITAPHNQVQAVVKMLLSYLTGSFAVKDAFRGAAFPEDPSIKLLGCDGGETLQSPAVLYRPGDSSPTFLRGSSSRKDGGKTGAAGAQAQIPNLVLSFGTLDGGPSRGSPRKSAAVLNVHDATGHTALHHAVVSRRPAVINPLITHGADVNAFTKPGLRACFQDGAPTLNPLMLAILNRDTPSLRKLLKAGAAPSICNSDGVTPALLAVETGQPDVVEALVLSHGTRAEQRAFLEEQAKRHGLFRIAVARNAGAIVDLLLRYEVSFAGVFDPCQHNRSALMVACSHGEARLVSKLLAAYEPDETSSLSAADYINYRDGQGLTAVSIAASAGHLDIVLMLVRRGAKTCNHRSGNLHRDQQLWWVIKGASQFRRKASSLSDASKQGLSQLLVDNGGCEAPSTTLQERSACCAVS